MAARFDWTPERLETLNRMVIEKCTGAAMSDALGCSYTTALVKAEELGIRDRPERKHKTLAPVPLAKLESAIIKPGFEKHLEPLLYYKGNQSLGRVHRLWNFSVSLMIQRGESVSDATQRFSMNARYSHLCEPDTPVQASSLYSFWSRLLDTPRVHGENLELVDFVRSLPFRRFHLDRLPVITSNPNARWVGPGGWRVHKTAERKPGNVQSRGPLSYPFMIHDGGKPEHDLIRLVTKAVPSGIMGDLRADICQDLIVGILCGDFNKDDLSLPKKEVMRRIRKLYPDKYSHVSLDATIPGTDGLRLLDRI